jgi:Quinolinate synthetase A protein
VRPSGGQLTPTTSTCRRVRNTVIRAAIALNVGHEFRAARSHPGITVLAHPECPPEVVAACGFTGSWS